MSTQRHRALRVKIAGLAEDELFLLGLSGREAISQPFSFQLEMMSENFEIDAARVLRAGAAVTIVLPDASERRVHGVVSRFAQLGVHEDLAFYSAEIVPWLWFLSLSRDCKVFQNLTVLDIVEEVFKAQGYSDYDIRCTHSYPKREYCVQYRESSLDFISRLLQEEGIFYFFEHSESAHRLVLTDVNARTQSCPGAATSRVAVQPNPDEDVITRLMREDSVHVGKVTFGDFDPLQTSLTLRSSISGAGPEEIYDYQPVIYTDPAEGDRFARVQLEAEEASRRVIRGESTCRAFQAGYRVNVDGHYRSDINGAYLLTEVRHLARGGSYRTWRDAAVDYTNEFVCIPFDISYRAARTVRKPTASGAQTAIVVGKADEEIWTDRYGRVKVKFHWDRQGKKDENSSCWVRVSSAWAGKAWGAIHLPRVGQEVIVDFIEGDIDRPVIVGRLFNSEQMPPYTLPADQTQSGIKSRSSKGGGAENYNEIRFEDKKGAELLYIHAEMDQQIVVENDRTASVGRDDSVTIGNDSRLEVGANRATHVNANDDLEVGGSLRVDAKSNIHVKAGAKIVIEAGAAIELKVGSSTLEISPAGIELKAQVVNGVADAVLRLNGGITMIN